MPPPKPPSTDPDLPGPDRVLFRNRFEIWLAYICFAFMGLLFLPGVLRWPPDPFSVVMILFLTGSAWYSSRCGQLWIRSGSIGGRGVRKWAVPLEDLRGAHVESGRLGTPFRRSWLVLDLTDGRTMALSGQNISTLASGRGRRSLDRLANEIDQWAVRLRT